MDEHVCKFKLVGGGCMMVEGSETPCHSHYKCECGNEFRTKENTKSHFAMPLEIIGKDKTKPIEVNLPEGLDQEKKDD